MKLLNRLLMLSSVSAALLFSSCSKDKNTNKKDASGIFYGTAAPLASGTVRSFVVLDQAGNPVTVGMRFSEAALSGLPTDSTKEWEFPFELPAEAKTSGFDHMVIDWNPVGHEPKPIYGLPHFDFHFYRINKEDQGKVIPGPDTVKVAAKYVPQDYVSGIIAVPDMGVHWSDVKAPEFNGQKFTDTFIYGFYHGQMTFMEPMITKAFLETKPDFKINIKQPEAFQKSGFYPTISHISYDATAKEYVVALEGLIWADAK